MGGNEASPPLPQKWILGRIHAEWCGHCIRMKRDWNLLRIQMKKEKRGVLEIKDIEEKEMHSMLEELHSTYFHGKGRIQSGGFPTIFMFRTDDPEKTLVYYTEDRNYAAMKNWIERTMRSQSGVARPHSSRHTKKIGGHAKHHKRVTGGVMDNLLGSLIGGRRIRKSKGKTHKNQSMKFRRSRHRKRGG